MGKNLQRFFSLLLTTVVTVLSLNNIVLAQNDKIQQQTVKSEDVKIITEIKSERTHNSNTYLLSDGSKKLEIYSENIRYKQDGKYIDYNPTLVELKQTDKQKIDILGEDNYSYVNQSGDCKQYFPEKITKNDGVMLLKDHYSIKMLPVVDENYSIKINGTIATYSNDIYKQSYVYTSLNNGIKEDIILNKEPKDNVFSYNIITKNVILSHKKNDRGIQILDKNTKKVVAYIPAPNLIDGNGNINYEDVHYNLVNKKNNIVLQIVVDEKYFENDELAYPVKIDPYMVWMDDYLAASGVWSVPFMADSTIINNHLVVSNNLIDSYPYNSENRVYIDTSNILTEKAFVGSGDTISNKYIEEAYLCIHESSKPAHYPTGTVQVKTVSEQWDSSTITWNTQPQISDECIAEFKSTGTEGEFHKLDISDWIRKLATGTEENNGLVLTCPEKGMAATIYGPQLHYIVDNEGHSVDSRHMMISILYRDEYDVTHYNYKTGEEYINRYDGYENVTSNKIEDGYNPSSTISSSEINTRSIIPGGSLKRIDSNAYPYSTIVSFATNPTATSGYGSGFVIGPNLIATAAHCVFNGSEWVKNIYAISGIGTDEAKAYSVKEIYCPTLYIRGYEKSKYDWALVVVDENIGEKTGWLGFKMSDTLINENISVLGYTTYKDSGYDDWHLYQDTGNIINITERNVFYNASTQGGQSGGAIIDSNNIVRGIHAYGAGSYNMGTRISNMMFELFSDKKNEGINLYN